VSRADLLSARARLPLAIALAALCAATLPAGARAQTAAASAQIPAASAQAPVTTVASSTTYAFPWRTTTFQVVETVPERHRSTVVVIVPGAFASDANGDYPALAMRPHFYEDLSDVVTAEGYPVIRYARRRDDWESEPNLALQVADTDLADRAAKVDRVIAFARSRPGVTGVVVVAHSEGCLFAARSRASVRGMLGISCPGLRLFDTFLDAAANAQGTSSFVYRRLAADVVAVRAGAVDTAPDDALGAYFFGAMSSAPLAYLREVDRIEPCAAYGAPAFPVELLSGGADPTSAAWPCGAQTERPVRRRLVAGADHFMRVGATSPIPWIKGDPELSPGFERGVRAWLAAFP
jgi:hypothetical protein